MLCYRLEPPGSKTCFSQVKSPMSEFADANWREGASITTTELTPNFCIDTVRAALGLLSALRVFL